MKTSLSTVFIEALFQRCHEVTTVVSIYTSPGFTVGLLAELRAFGITCEELCPDIWKCGSLATVQCDHCLAGVSFRLQTENVVVCK